MRDDDWDEDIGAACCDCQHFYDEGDESGVGQCRRFPPRDWFDSAKEAIWPRVATYQGCGEFELERGKRREWEEEKRRRISEPRK